MNFPAQHGESFYSNQSFNALAGRFFSVRYPELFNNMLMELGATLASPIAWEHHYRILFPIFVCTWLILWFGDVPVKNNWIKAAFVLFYLVAANVFPFAKFVANSHFNILQSYLLMAACGLFAILLLIKHPLKSKAGA